MSIQVSRQKLVLALSRIVSIVERRSTMPILEHVKVDIHDGQIFLTATDMDITATASLDLDSNSDSALNQHHNIRTSFTTVAQSLHDITRKMFNCQDITMDVADISKSIIITANGSQFTLPCLDATSFPNFDRIVPHAFFSLRVEELLFLLKQTKHAMSAGESRYYLNGLYLHTDEVGYLTSVATDIHRLALAKIAAPQEIAPGTGIILPRKTVIELARILEDCDSKELVQVEISQHKIQFSIPGLVLTSKLIDASFPNYRAALPQPGSSPAKVTVLVQELAKAIDLVTTIAEGKIKSVRVLISRSIISVSVDNQIGHKASGIQEVLIESQGLDKDVEILLNSRYILDALATIKGEKADILISSQVNPIVIQDSRESHSLCVLMPMQFGGINSI